MAPREALRRALFTTLLVRTQPDRDGVGIGEEAMGQDAVVSGIRRQDAQDQQPSQSEEGRVQLRLRWRTHPFHETEDEPARVRSRIEPGLGGDDAREAVEDR